jgi:tol-pal system-associated acyl-CoA thioesterase
MQEAKHQCRVYAYDTDYGGIVHHASYLRFLEQARTECLDQQSQCLKKLFDEQALFFVLRDLNAQYLAPARLHQSLLVITQVKTIRKTALLFEQTIVDQQDQTQILFTAELIMVCVNQQLRPQAIPENFMRILQ